MNNRREDIAPRKDIPVREDLAPRKDLKKASIPPPQSRPSTSALSILFVMAFVIIGAFVASGSATPLDPNGPGGPPTLGPYYNSADYPVQHIVTPTGGFNTGKQNLQLQTFTVDNCGDNFVTLFVIDTSGSMTYENKIGNEKTALNYFANNMGGLSVIGIDTFGGLPEQGDGEIKTAINLAYYKDVKPQVQKVISSLKPDGGTPTKDAMEVAYNQLKESIDNEDYPNYKYNLILMTDGVPEQLPPRTCEPGTSIYDPNDHGIRCFAQEQDPRVPINIPEEIKNLGVDIYSINVYSPSYASDNYLYPHLNAFLKDVASTPTSTHLYTSVNGSDLSKVLQSIDHNICVNDLNNTTSRNGK